MGDAKDILSAAQLAKIEARANAATPGPWLYKAGIAIKHYVYIADEGEDLGLSLQSLHWRDGRVVPAEANARFIAASREDVPALLRHVAALSAPLPEDGGEALGRELFANIVDLDRSEEYWAAKLTDSGRARFVEIAIGLYQRGHAAGALLREPIEASLRAAAIDAMDQRDARDATIARLTAELEVTRADGARVERDVAVAALKAEIGGCVTPGTDYERGLLMAIKIIRAGNAEGDKAREEQDRRREEKRIARAKEDGARVERERIVERVRRWAAEGAEGMPEAGDETVVDWIASEIERDAVDTSARGDR